MVVNDPLDLTLTLHVGNGNTGERAVDLQSVNESGLRDHLECRHLLQDPVVERLVEDDGILRLQVRDDVR